MIELGKFIYQKYRNNGMKNFTRLAKKDNNYIFGRKFEFLVFSKANLTNQK